MGPASGISGSAGPVDTQMFPRTSRPTSLSEVDMGILTSSYATNSQDLLGAYAHPRGMPAHQDAIANWYAGNDGPWIPKGLALPDDDDRSPSRIHNMSFQGHMGFPGQYRERYVPSECETSPPGLAPSDSGYGSHATKHSVTTTSVYDEPMDRNTETQSLAGHLSEFHFPTSFGPGMEYMAKNTPSGAWDLTPQQSLQHSARPFEGKGIIVCETCKKQVKTNSELKHTKPFTCDVPGCARTEGFSTPNDLDRHKRSVHPDESPDGSRFQCPHGGCKSKDKIWPRADNFRAHLKRVHRIENVKDEDLEGTIYQPQAHPPSQTQDMLPDLAGVPEQTAGDYGEFQISPSLDNGRSQSWPYDEDHATDEGMHHTASSQADYPPPQLDDTRMALGHMTGGTCASNEMVQPASEDERLSMRDTLEAIGPIQHHLSQSMRPSMQDPPEQPDLEERNSQFISPGDLEQEHQSSSSSRVSSTHTETSRSSVSYEDEDTQSPIVGAKLPTYDGSVNSTSMRESGKQEASTTIAQQPQVVSVSDISSLQLELKDPDKRRKLVEALQMHGILEEFGFKKESSPVVETRSEDVSQGIKPENYHPCTESGCDKKFMRPCELKKHLKRHSKPYGCTFQNCSKRFGSKNDWKRHENSQHFLHEAWRCDMQRSNSRSPEVCGKLSHRRETFKEHLSKVHSLQGDELEIKLEHCRVGRNCEARFWCGFCENIIEIERKGLGAFTERFNHIDDHFSGRDGLPRKQIDDWKGVDPDAPPMEALSSDSEDGDSAPPSQPGPLSAPLRSARKGTPKEQHSHLAALKKRKRDEEEVVGHHAKRAKAPASTTSVGVVTRCVSA
ncbi:hypothetical protein PG996_002352 [Apiospora saccharicola]|uniref:C2H2-type domain-containing protein n=1 Tax=Apiospora saccharicola TaxID=335842 RepID=A0ABR1WM95_9PEZI